MGSAEASVFRSWTYRALHTFVAPVPDNTPWGHRLSATDSPVVNLLSFPNLICANIKGLTHSLPQPPNYTKLPVAPQTHHTPSGFHLHDFITSLCWNYFLLLPPPLFPGQSLVIVKIQFRHAFYQEAFHLASPPARTSCVLLPSH